MVGDHQLCGKVHQSVLSQDTKYWTPAVLRNLRKVFVGWWVDKTGNIVFCFGSRLELNNTFFSFIRGKLFAELVELSAA